MDGSGFDEPDMGLGLDDLDGSPLALPNGFDENEAAKLKEQKKDEKEIEKLTIDEGLGDVERIHVLIRSENMVQKCGAVLSLLPMVLPTVEGAGQVELLRLTLEELQPILEDRCRNDRFSSEMTFSLISRIAASVSTLEGKQLILHALIGLGSKLAESIYYGHASLEKLQMMDKAMMVIEEILEALTVRREELLQTVEKACFTHIDNLESCGARIFGAKLLGLLMRFKYLVHVGDILKRTTALCGDVETEVRASICEQMGDLCEGLSADVFIDKLLGDYLEFDKDEEPDVRIAYLRALRKVCLNVDTDTVVKKLSPGMGKSAQMVVSRKDALSYLGEKELALIGETVNSFGPFLYALRPVVREQMNDENSTFRILLSVYITVLGLENCEDLHYICAYNFPGILKALGGINFAKHLLEPFQALIEHQTARVRHVIASSMHDIAQILGKQRMARNVADLLPSLLRDKDFMVRRAMLEHFIEIIDSFSVADLTQREEVYKKLLPTVLDYLLLFEENRTDWRFRKTCLEHFVTIHQYFPHKALHEASFPILMDYMRNCGIPLRQEAIKTLCWMLRNNTTTCKELQIIHDIKAEFCRGHAWYLRSLFVHFLVHACQLFDTSFAEKYRFEQAILDLITDKVAVVKVEVCKNIIHFARWRIIHVKVAKAALQEVLQGGEEDRDVKSCAEDALETLNTSEEFVELEKSQPASSFNSSTTNSLTSFPKLLYTPNGGTSVRNGRANNINNNANYRSNNSKYGSISNRTARPPSHGSPGPTHPSSTSRGARNIRRF